MDLTNIYNRQLQELIESQEAEIISINEQMLELDKTNRGILPKLEEMVNTLSSIVENDTPFLLTERLLRIDELKNILIQSNVSTSEKFRRVFEAYQIENEYGRTIETYRDTINIDGVDTSADFLRIGRIALTYLTTDGSKGGYYDLNERTFLKSSGSIKRATEDGLKIAAKQAPPALIQIPIYKD